MNGPKQSPDGTDPTADIECRNRATNYKYLGYLIDIIGRTGLSIGTLERCGGVDG
jgi:hypothetical protein